MSSFILCDAGVLKLLNVLKGAWGTLKMGTCKASFAPLPTDNLAKYQAIESDYPGYARQDLLHWQPPVLVETGTAVSLADVVEFRRTGGGPAQSIYGVFVVTADGTLLYAQLDPNGPWPMVDAGSLYAVLPAFRLLEP